MEEALAWKRLIETSRVALAVAPDLFAGATASSISERIVAQTGMSASTADRRASTLTRWRDTVQAYLPEQGREVAPERPDAGAERSHDVDVSDASAGEAGPAVGRAGTATEWTMPATSLSYLRNQMRQARLVLLSGAGFSIGAFDVTREPLPLGWKVGKDLWPLAFPGHDFDEKSSLQDIFAEALDRKPREVDRYLRERFAVDASRLPPFYEAWFSVPWHRVYTLNVDDLESAANRQFDLPRTYRPVSALQPDEVAATAQHDETLVVHLNGVATDGGRGVTFSHSQYAQRLADNEPWYARLAAELALHPFVFVGSPMEEPLFWQHIEIRSRKQRHQRRELRPRSFLVSPMLAVARVELLKKYNVEWVPLDAEQFANQVLAEVNVEVRDGHQALRIRSRAADDAEESIASVAQLLAEQAPGQRSLFLLGAEPTWEDVVSGTAAPLAIDEELWQEVQRLLHPIGGSTRALAPIVALTGSAGAGKSTSVRRLAIRMHADGAEVAWVGPSIEASPRTIRNYCSHLACDVVVVIDEADRYGTQLAPLLSEISVEDHVKAIVVAMRSSGRRLLTSAALQDNQVTEKVMPPLQDADIAGLIVVLEQQNRLGRLTGMSHPDRIAAFREGAQRQLLVAMIEATSGQRFDSKVLHEWSALGERARYLYATVALATSLGGGITQANLLLAAGSRGHEELQALEEAKQRYVIVEEPSSVRLKARHLVIAEKLITQLRDHGTYLQRVYSDLTRAVALTVGPELSRSAAPWRLLKRLLNHDPLSHALGFEGARQVYDEVAETLGWDYHFWLQRGSLELEDGDIREAENFIESAFSLNEDDPFVRTAYGYMSLKRARCSPNHPQAEQWADAGVVLLTQQITARGKIDFHPYHVLGSQGLAWSRRAGWSRERRREFNLMLREMIGHGIRNHPGRDELRRLAEGIDGELRALALQ